MNLVAGLFDAYPKASSTKLIAGLFDAYFLLEIGTYMPSSVDRTKNISLRKYICQDESRVRSFIFFWYESYLNGGHMEMYYV